MKTDKGKDRTKRSHDRVDKERPLNVLHVQKINRRLRKHSKDSTKFRELAEHFEATFEPWMNWSNYGLYKRDGPRTWNVGHKIPCSAYADTMSEMAKCFDLRNLFAQDSKENATQRMKMPDQATLATLVDIWPASMCV